MKTHRAQEDAFLSEHRVARRVGRRLFLFVRLLSDKGRRARLGLFLGLFCNLAYLFFWFLGSLFSGFFFFGITSFYFLFISLLRIYLSHAFEKADLNARWRAFRVTGLLLWLLNLFHWAFRCRRFLRAVARHCRIFFFTVLSVIRWRAFSFLCLSFFFTGAKIIRWCWPPGFFRCARSFFPFSLFLWLLSAAGRSFLGSVSARIFSFLRFLSARSCCCPFLCWQKPDFTPEKPFFS